MAKAVSLIPARAGSKGVPGKNIRSLAGRSLIERAVACSLAAGCFDRVVVSTDDEAYASEAKRAGAEVLALRPPQLATDTTPMVEVVRHELENLSQIGAVPEIVAIVQPTSPMRLPEHLVSAIELLRCTPGCDSVVAVSLVPAALSPDYVMEIRDGRLVMFLAQERPLTRRQDARRAYYRNGVVYATRTQVVFETGSLYGESSFPLVLPAEFGLSIDAESDWQAAALALRAREGL